MKPFSRHLFDSRSSQNRIPLLAVVVSLVALPGSAAAQTGGRTTLPMRSCTSLSSRYCLAARSRFPTMLKNAKTFESVSGTSRTNSEWSPPGTSM